MIPTYHAWWNLAVCLYAVSILRTFWRAKDILNQANDMTAENAVLSTSVCVFSVCVRSVSVCD